jgi:hypothetical protein
MMDENVCKNCTIKHKKIKYDLEEYDAWNLREEKMWFSTEFFCTILDRNISTYKIESKCPYKLEHLLRDDE